MTQSRRRFLLIAAGFAATPTLARARAPVWSGRALGAEAAITLSGPAERIRPALADAVAVLRRMERLFSLYDPASALSRLNAQGRLDAPPPEMRSLLAAVDHVHAGTGGRFDPTVQPLWRALAEGRDTAAARAALGWSRVRVTPEAVLLDPGQALTLNGIAQGFATDRVQQVLRAHGFDRTLVNIGEFAGDGGPWRLGVEDPRQGFLLTRDLTDGAMATSSPGAMALGGLADRQGHILDPRGGGPHWSTITVEADSATLADAASTALCLATRAEIPGFKARLPGVRRITAIDDDGGIATL